MDIYLLNHCDFTVGTFSSNVLRLVDEQKLSEKSPISGLFTLGNGYIVESLDERYYLASATRRSQAIYNHSAIESNVINLMPRDNLVDSNKALQERKLQWNKSE